MIHEPSYKYAASFERFVFKFKSPAFLCSHLGLTLVLKDGCSYIALGALSRNLGDMQIDAILRGSNGNALHPLPRHPTPKPVK